MTRYQVIDKENGKVMATFSTHKAADRKAEKLSFEYGQVRYAVRAVDTTDPLCHIIVR